MTAGLWPRHETADAGLARPAGAGGSPGRARRLRGGWFLGAALVLLAVVGVVLTVTGPGPSNAEPLDPRNPGNDGTQAVARVLADHGVAVTVARNEAELRRAGADANTTVVVARTSELAEATVRGLSDASRGAERLVVFRPDPWLLRYLAPEVTSREERRAAEALVSGCDTPDVRPGERLSRSQMEFATAAGSRPVAACFTNAGYSVYLDLAATGRHPRLVLVGSTTAVLNESIQDHENAAVVLRTLGHSDRLVWYVPDLRDVPTDDTSTTQRLLPPWLGPSVLLVTFAMLAVLLWRGRRLGPLVTEPLPVVIRAIETTESRGRLYRKARDASRAAAVLQQATRSRLRARLGLPPSAPTPVLAQAVADATGRRLDEVSQLLGGQPPADEAAMLGLAAQLAVLEKEVCRT